MNKPLYGYRKDGSIWVDQAHAMKELVETYHSNLMDMDEEQLTEEYVNKFGDPNRP